MSSKVSLEENSAQFFLYLQADFSAFFSPGFWGLFCIAAHFSLVMYGLSLSKIPYADFLDTFIYVHSLIENLIFKVIILIDVCHFDQAVAHRCFVKTILQVSLSSCLSLLTFCMACCKKTHWRHLSNSRFTVSSLLKTIIFQISMAIMQCRGTKTSNRNLP